tara:strand:- start:912 stop:2279 length:1368 start_codon:yes stop_codon:yes gene_type:complete
MNDTNKLTHGGFRMAALCVVLSLFLSGCYWTAAKRYTDRTGTVPWWCQGTPDLSIADCLSFSANLDLAIEAARQYPTRTDAEGTLPPAPYPPAVAITHYLLNPVSGSFDAAAPNVVGYDANDQLAVIGWLVESDGVAPEGFPGSRDVWSSQGGSPEQWLLYAWAIRPYENHPDIFAATQPCLDLGGPGILTATTDACYQAAHTVPLDIMVTNDDGYDAPGIDALVEALTDDPNDPVDSFVAGIEVTVVAPLTQQSGQGDNTTPGGAPAASEGLTTASGYPVLAAVHGTPADSVIWALQDLSLSPDLVISGINSGQNLATLGSNASGTIGAARTAMRRGRFESFATSAQLGIPDWPAATAATLEFLELWRLGRVGLPFMEVPNINIPSCNGGGAGNRGFLETVAGTDLSSGGYGDPTNCDPGTAKPAGSIVDDLDAWLNGFVGIADMGITQPPNYP